MHGSFQGISAPSGGTACSHAFPTFKPFPGCAPAGTYYDVPYADTIGRDVVFTWHFPRAASLSQLVVSNWTFGSSDGAEGTGMFMTILDDTSQTFVDRVGVLSWTGTERTADRGTVWDINHVVQKGATVTITYLQYKGPNQNNNAFVMSITGSWLRDDV